MLHCIAIDTILALVYDVRAQFVVGKRGVQVFCISILITYVDIVLTVTAIAKPVEGTMADVASIVVAHESAYVSIFVGHTARHATIVYDTAVLASDAAHLGCVF